MMIMLFAHRNPPQNTSVVMMKMVALLSSRRDPEWWLPSGQSGKQTDIVSLSLLLVLDNVYLSSSLLLLYSYKI